MAVILSWKMASSSFTYQSRQNAAAAVMAGASGMLRLSECFIEHRLFIRLFAKKLEGQFRETIELGQPHFEKQASTWFLPGLIGIRRYRSSSLTGRSDGSDNSIFIPGRFGIPASAVVPGGLVMSMVNVLSVCSSVRWMSPLEVGTTVLIRLSEPICG